MDEGTKKMRLNLVAQWIKAQAESGLTKEQWMKENHISRWTFYQYQRELRKLALDSTELQPLQEENKLEEPAFVEITNQKQELSVVKPESKEMVSSHVDDLRITCRDFTLTIPETIKEGTLVKVLRAMKHAD
ncbi:MAG: hypothetical protein SPL23_11525 [Lachnospiraceae bacterium]|nr:hypothetical protein [Lachnospiraceae bacterium]